MFYNVENLFDTFDNPNTNDDEFLPNGKKNWTFQRYNNKLKHIRQVISAVDYEQFPDLIGLCEVENADVLSDLINKAPLKTTGYKIFHHESRDFRGIDNAILYNPSTFKLLNSNVFRIHFKDTSYFSRDILYVKGEVRHKKDTLHVFVNHWPSRYGGQLQSEDSRLQAAKTLRHCVDSVLKLDSLSKILCIGDFNDTPSDRSITEGLKAKTSFTNIDFKSLYNISYYLQFEKKLWTYAFHEDYSILDQVIVSGALITKNKLFISPDNVEPLKKDFMLKPDENFNLRPWRTYYGYKYEGGFSDHLPVVIRFSYK